MTDIYQRGKIYKIVCNTTGLCYIGSSTQKTLAKRLGEHKSTYTRFKKNEYYFVTSFKVLENTKDELHSRERY